MVSLGRPGTNCQLPAEELTIIPALEKFSTFRSEDLESLTWSPITRPCHTCVLTWSPLVVQVPSANFRPEERVLAGRNCQLWVWRSELKVGRNRHLPVGRWTTTWRWIILIFFVGGLSKSHIVVHNYALPYATSWLTWLLRQVPNVNFRPEDSFLPEWNAQPSGRRI